MSIAHLTESQRFIGTIERDEGPIFLIVAGVHGNEPAGIQAIHETLLELSYFEDKVKGSIYGIRGNLNALAEQKRYIDFDLNRSWEGYKLDHLDQKGSEFKEMAAIRQIIDEIKAIQGDRQLILLDLHTTSSDSLPFILCSNKPPNRRLVKPIPVPTVFGVENRIRGTLMNYINNMGDAAIVFEAGQHDDPFSIVYHKSIIQLFLVGAGILNQSDLDDFEDTVNNLYHHAREMQYIFEIMFRYGIKPNEKFKMKPGYKNFMKIEQGEVLASNERCEIVAPLPGRIFMPLYQSLGDDGFFIIDEIV